MDNIFQEKMNREDLILAIQELIDETHEKAKQTGDKQGHYIWINGRICELKEAVENLFKYIIVQVDEKGMLGWAEKRLRELAKEYEETKNSKATYSSFGG